MDNQSEADQRLIQWNSEVADLYIPSTVIQIVYLVLGIIGNCLVIIVYQQWKKRNKGDRLFIIALAVVDFFGCIFSITLSLLYNVVSVRFPSSAVCKIFHFGACTCIVCSLLILFVISIQRFQKLYRPFGSQMNLRRKQTLTVLVIVVAIILSIPALLLNDRVTLSNAERNVDGYICRSPPKPSLQIYSDVFHGGLIAIEVIILIVMCILYAFVGRKLVHQFKFSPKKDRPFQQSQLSIVKTSQESSTSERHRNQSSVGSALDEHDSSKESGKNKTKSSSGSGRRYTFIFLLITVVAIVCYIPPLIILFMETRDKTFWHDKSSSLQLSLNIIRRLYIVNHVANPFIYAFCDTEFRSELKSVLSVINCRKHK